MLFFYVQCHFRTWSIMAIHNFLSFVALSSFWPFDLVLPFIHSNSLCSNSRFPPASLNSIYPVGIKFFRPSFFIMCSNFSCLFLIADISFLVVLIFPENFLIAHIFCSSYSQYLLVESHHCHFKFHLHLWGDCPVFTAIKGLRYYIAVQHFVFFFFLIFSNVLIIYLVSGRHLSLFIYL